MRFVVMADAAYRDIATMCIATICHHHPTSSIVQLTDSITTRLDGVDDVWRCEGTPRQPWYTLDFMRVLGQMDATPTAVVGSDTLVCKPMDDVWEDEFDVALTRREGHLGMPYNLGISFCRQPAFFAAVYARMDGSRELRAWMGDQRAVAQEVRADKWKVRELRGATWNNSNIGEKKIPQARMLHYKGPRKEWMAKHYRMGVWQ